MKLESCWLQRLGCSIADAVSGAVVELVVVVVVVVVVEGMRSMLDIPEKGVAT